MTPSPSLTTELRAEVLKLEEDMRERLEADPERKAQWQQDHQRAKEMRRTAAGWTSFRDDRITQAAVGWVLFTVFVRFCEDNRLLEPVWIAGPADRRQEALDAELAYFRAYPEHTHREWLEQAIAYFAKLPATAGLVDQYSALHLIAPSGNAIETLLKFWRERSNDGTELSQNFFDLELSTRFLGNLYQELSSHAKATFALLQTPEFVEEFILDRTLELALDERPLERVSVDGSVDIFRLIDPTCGSGHFLLGAFERIFKRWDRLNASLDVQAKVQKSLDAVHGVDLNPFAVSIARFRLTIAALRRTGQLSLEQAPQFALHLAVGDSLLHGPGQQTLQEDADLSSFVYSTEDLSALREILAGGRYDVVIGNPPYIAVKDKALNAEYRSRYNTCKGTYALTVPFMERFFDLARPGKEGQSSGWVGQITGNAFMKREFGVQLVEGFLTQKDLRLVVDTSGAHIPGHGTPTVILVGRNQAPVGVTVRAVLGIRGEPTVPKDPAQGNVWRAIVDCVEGDLRENSWVSGVSLDRSLLSAHPWSLSGGGSLQLRAQIESESAGSIESLGVTIGGLATTGEDSAYEIGPGDVSRRLGVAYSRELVLGESVSDYAVETGGYAVFPYSDSLDLAKESVIVAELKALWPVKSTLLGRRRFGTPVSGIRGFSWYEYRELYKNRLSAGAIAVFRKISTHNHAVVDHHGRVFREALHGLAGENLEVILVVHALLNSSTACFWLKQNSHDKGIRGEGGGVTADSWERFYEFSGSTLKHFPVPDQPRVERGRLMDGLACEFVHVTPVAVCGEGTPTVELFKVAQAESERIRARMIFEQEELDWEVYRLYGLVKEDLTYGGDDAPGLALGERAFEIVLARSEEETAWFTRHGSKPIKDMPEHWPADYRDLVQRRLDLIASDKNIRLLEKPEYKRRWSQEPWEKRQTAAVRDWLLDRLEDRKFWFDAQGGATPRSVAQLADEVARDADLTSVLALWEGRPDVPVTKSLLRLLADEAVPYLAAYRYKDSGLRKREVWEQTWALQRREDAGENVGTIDVPPKYTSADFRKPAYWHARGKLDVPKERFILYPDAGRDTDATPLLGWAGWDHAQQSLALLLVLGEREAEGWSDERLKPLVAGLAELQPWVEQWHAEVDPTYGLSLADFCGEQLTSRASQVEMSLDDLRVWQPEVKRGRKKAASV